MENPPDKNRYILMGRKGSKARLSKMSRQQILESMKKISSFRTHEDFVRSGKKSWENKGSEKQNEIRKMAVKARLKDADMQIGEKCWSAKIWHLRDPNNKVWNFRNLTHFVRTHKHLFDPSDLNWTTPKNGKLTGLWCRATGGLRTLRPTRKSVVCGTWKGWRWVSIFERRFNEGDDLLLPLKNY